MEFTLSDFARFLFLVVAGCCGQDDEDKAHLNMDQYLPWQLWPEYIALPYNVWLRYERAEEFSPVCNDFKWRKKNTEVMVLPLLWWNDASYIKYQSEDFEDYSSEQVVINAQNIQY